MNSREVAPTPRRSRSGVCGPSTSTAETAPARVAPAAGATLAGAISAALVDGPQTPDLLRLGVGATTREFTARVLAGFQLSLRNAEFWPEAV